MRKISYNAPVVLTFSIISFFILLISGFTDGALIQRLFTLRFTSFADPMMYLRIVTHVLGHADWEHYSGNIMLLLLTGPMLEEKYGSKRLLIVVLFTSVVSGLLNVILFPNIAVLGASGVVFAFILLASITGGRDKGIPLTLIVVAVLYLGAEVFDGIFAEDAVSQLSHIIGGVVGCAFGYMYRPHRKEAVTL